MRTTTRRTISFSLLLTLATPVTSAATRYVEMWGTDAVGPCAKTNPCFAIGTAIDVSGKNDRIVVGPGTYTETNLSIQPPREGLRLESTAGRHATTIVSGNGGSVLTIEAVRVKVGKKGKGFTFIGATNNAASAGINVNVPEESAAIRIEGNIGIRVASGGIQQLQVLRGG